MTDEQRANDYRRPEAQAFPWYTLIQHHRDALGQIMGLLRSAVDALPAPAKPASDPMSRANTLRVRANRASQLAFLHGARGTGKTSVELSLRRALLSPKGMEEMTAVPPSHARSNAESRVSEEVARLRELAKAIEPKLVWLTPLDMEPLPEGVNALAAILVRLEQAIADMDRDPAAHRGWLARSEHDDSLASTLESLRTDVVYAWDGGMRQRSAGQDLDSWAAEVVRAERARLDLNSRFTALLDHMAWQRHERGQSNPLFVLVVDDFDLSPVLCVELLRVVRMITTPRLFFILAGDLKIAHDVMHIKAAGDGTSMLAAPTRQGLFEDNVRRIAESAASNNLRKLVPPRHRVELRALKARESLQVHLPNQGILLEEALARIEFETNGVQMSVLEALQGPWRGPVPDGLNTKPYRFFEAFLQAPIRAIVDTWSMLTALQAHPSHLPTSSAVADVIAEELERRVDELELSQQPEWLREALRDAIRERLPSDVFALTPVLTETPRTVDRIHYFRVARYAWTIPEREKDPRPVTPRRPLPAAIPAGLALIHDLSVDAGVAGLEPDRVLLLRASKSLGLIRHDSPDGHIEVRWPELEWDRIGDQMLFNRLWSRDWAEGPVDSSLLLNHWLATWYAVETGQHACSISGVDPERLAHCLGQTETQLSDRQRRAQVLAMLAPEMGWPEATTSVILRCPEVSRLADDPGIAREVRSFRVERLQGVAPRIALTLLPRVSPAAWQTYRASGKAAVNELRHWVETRLPMRETIAPVDDWKQSVLRWSRATARRLSNGKVLAGKSIDTWMEQAAEVEGAVDSIAASTVLEPLPRRRLRTVLSQNLIELGVLLRVNGREDDLYNRLADGAFAPDWETVRSAWQLPTFQPIDP